AAVDARRALAVERAQQRRLPAQRAVHAQTVGGRALVEDARAEKHPARAHQLQRGAAPHLGEGVETVLQEGERGEGTAGGEIVHDLVVEQRVDVAERLGRRVRTAQLDEAEAAGRQLAEALQAIATVGGDGTGGGGRREGKRRRRPPQHTRGETARTDG